ncbi:MAG: hypothetical protein JNN00_16160 [Chitinophagaceae bacterium]|nr:hypothetical protein [Chitinophagaceae bacterium]
MRLLLLFGVIFLLALASCSEKKGANSEAVKQSMMKADIAFSGLSKQKGMKAAFLQYIDTAGVLLRPGHYPIIGKDAREYLQKTNDSSFTLTWEPSAAEAGAAGDLGFTYGIYTLTTTDTVIKGTYVSIWKKQPDGDWRFLLDTGNPGVGREK